MTAWPRTKVADVDADPAERLDVEARALRLRVAGLTEAPEDFGVIQFGKRLLVTLRMSRPSSSHGWEAHAQLLAVLEEVEQAQAKLAEGTYGTLRRVRRPHRRGAPLKRSRGRPNVSRCRSAHDRRR